MKKLLSIVIIIMLSVLVACGNNSQEGETKVKPVETGDAKISQFTTITPEDAKKRLDSEDGIILLDVRTQEEYEEAHIKNSMLIPVDNIEAEAEDKLTDKEATIFVYCRSGRRSAIAAEALVNMGYKNIYDLGGIINWPYDTVSGK